MPIDKAKAMQAYKDRTAQSGSKLVDNYIATPGKMAKAFSEESQKSYVAAMTDPNVLKRRLTNGRKVDEGAANEAMRAKGASAYAAGTAAGADKFSKNVAPYLDTIDRVRTSLPARTRDAAQNVANRVTPLAVALQKQKNSQ